MKHWRTFGILALLLLPAAPILGFGLAVRRAGRSPAGLPAGRLRRETHILEIELEALPPAGLFHVPHLSPKLP